MALQHGAAVILLAYARPMDTTAVTVRCAPVQLQLVPYQMVVLLRQVTGAPAVRVMGQDGVVVAGLEVV